MATIFNESIVSFELKQSPVPEFAWHTSRKLAEVAGAKQLLFEIRSLDPGKYSYPYHFHRSVEEIFVIISGRATLRTPDGFQEVQEGDTVFFETGPAGAHQLFNHTDAPCKYLDLRKNAGIDICEYPDSGKINILPYEEVYMAEQVDYFEGERKVAEKWEEISEK